MRPGSHDGPAPRLPDPADLDSRRSRAVVEPSRVGEPLATTWPSDPALPAGLGGLSDGVPAALPRALPGPPFGGLAELLGRVTSGLDRAGVAALGFPLAVAVLSRLYSSLLLWLVPIIQPVSPVPRISGFLDTFLQWDGQWYVMVANTGYHAAPMQAGPFGGRHDFAFFPAWPTLLRAFRTFGVQPGDIAAPLANLLFIVAAVLIFLVLRRYLGLTAARWGLVLLAFSPPAFVLSLAYSEPLFLALAAASFLPRTGILRPILAGAAMLTRVTGIGLAVGAGLAWLRNPRDWRSFLTAGAVAAAFAGWWGFIWLLTGNPAGWLLGSARWDDVLGLASIADAITSLVAARLFDVAFVAVMLGASILVLRRNLELGVFSIVAIGLSILGAPVDSMPRHALVAFPAFGLLAERLGPRRSLALAIAFALIQANYVYLSFIFQHPFAP